MIFTIGHSTHDPLTFKRLLAEAGLTGIVDVRSHRSSHWAWWSGDKPALWLDRGGFTYQWSPQLGGWDVRHTGYVDWATPRGVKLDAYLRGYFPKQRIGADADQQYEHKPEWESGWTSQGLHDYAWYTSINEFLSAVRRISELYGGADQPRLALVCSEAPWWKCHRSMVADVLTHVVGTPVSHVMPSGKRVRITEHDPEPRIGRYPLEVRARWKEVL